MSSETRKKLRTVDTSCYLAVIQTFSERRIGKEIVNEALSAMNYTGDESDAPDIAA